jgi:hypothetical protein
MFLMAMGDFLSFVRWRKERADYGKRNRVEK